MLWLQTYLSLVNRCGDLLRIHRYFTVCLERFVLSVKIPYGVSGCMDLMNRCYMVCVMPGVTHNRFLHSRGTSKQRSVFHKLYHIFILLHVRHVAVSNSDSWLFSRQLNVSYSGDSTWVGPQ